MKCLRIIDLETLFLIIWLHFYFVQFFSDELEKPLRIKKYIYNKRQNSIGIVEMCCSNPFGCSIEALSSFCADDSVYVSMSNIRLSI